MRALRVHQLFVLLLSFSFLLPHNVAGTAAPRSFSHGRFDFVNAKTTSSTTSSTASTTLPSWETLLRGGAASLSFLEQISQSTLPSDIAQGAHERRQYYREVPPQQALSLLFLPSRLIRLGVLALTVAELLHKLGIIDTGPDELQAKLEEYWKDSGKPWTEKVVRHWQDSWKKARAPGGIFHANTWSNFHNIMEALQTLPYRYQFAVGGALGLVGSPLLWTVGTSALKVATIAYFVSEANYYIVTHDILNDNSNNNSNRHFWSSAKSSSPLLLPPQLHGTLERVRVAVRNLIKSPKAVLTAAWDELDERLPQQWELPPFLSRGLVLGTAIGLIFVL